MTAEANVIVVGNIRISPDRVEELQDGRPILTVMRQDIRSVHLRHGFLARHPVAQIIFGTLLTLGSGIFVLFGIQMAQAGKVMLWPILAGVFTLLGLWIIHDGLKRGHFLEIWTVHGRSKLAVGNVDAQRLAVAAKSLGI